MSRRQKIAMVMLYILSIIYSYFSTVYTLRLFFEKDILPTVFEITFFICHAVIYPYCLSIFVSKMVNKDKGRLFKFKIINWINI